MQYVCARFATEEIFFCFVFFFRLSQPDEVRVGTEEYVAVRIVEGDLGFGASVLVVVLLFALSVRFARVQKWLVSSTPWRRLWPPKACH